MISDIKNCFKKRLLIFLPVGFFSGLPLLLTSATLGTWLADLGVNKTTIGLFALVGNIISTFILFIYRDYDINLKSSYICVRNDTLGNLLTIAAGIIIMNTQSYIPDVIVGTIIGLFVLYSAANIGKESFNIIGK